MKKLKRIGAWAGILILVGFASGALIFSFIDAAWAKAALSICLYCAIMVPVFLYAVLLVARVLRDHSTRDHSADGKSEDKDGKKHD
ncbi:MAG: hypothetical protein ACI4EG_15500 [Fusicatenibacter sp.]|nr:hypothetical protein [Fusicatenibacter sp.]